MADVVEGDGGKPSCRQGGGTLSPATEADLYRFSAAAGDRFFFDSRALSSGLTPVWRLVDPFGNSVFASGLGGDVDTLVLTAPGSYTLLIAGNLSNAGSGTYTFNVQPVDVTPTPLTLGSTVSAAIGVAGESDVYTFTLAAESRLYFDALTNNNRLRWTLVGPAGTAVNNLVFTLDGSFNGNPVLELPAGAYTLTLDLGGDATGAYQFRLLDLAAATPLIPGTPVSGTLNPANETDLYRFTAAAGDRLFFDVQARSGASRATWRLVDPYGNLIFNNASFSTDVDVMTLPTAGTYTLLVEGRVDDTTANTYTFNVVPALVTTAALTLSATTSAAISLPGEQDRHTFTLAAPTRLYFDSLTFDNRFNWTLTGPPGTVVNSRLFGIRARDTADPVLDLPAGDYTLTVDATGDTTGAYQFRLVDLAAAVPLTSGTPVSGTLNPGNETDLYRFDAAAGDRFLFDSISRTGLFNTRWRLVDPFGAVVFANALSNDVGPLTLGPAGTYTLLIEGAVNETGTGSYSFNVQPQGNTPPAPLTGTPLTLGTTVSGSSPWPASATATCSAWHPALTQPGSPRCTSTA